MSGYALYFWESPLPNSQEEAARIVEQLESRRCEQRPVFLELAHRITARYPCSCSSDVAPEDDAWSDGPVDGRSNSPLYGLGLSLKMIEKVYPFVVDVARSLGLVTYDPEVEVVFLPSGEQFGYISFDDEEGEQVEPRDEWPWDWDSFRDIVRAEMEPFMRTNGFVYNKASEGFKKNTPSYQVAIEFCPEKDPSGVRAVRLFSCVELKFDKNIEQQMRSARLTAPTLVFDLSKLSGAGEWEEGADATTPCTYLNRRDIFWPASTIGGLRTVLRQAVIPFLAKVLLPLLDACHGWSDLNKHANAESEMHRFFKKSGAAAIIAHLVNHRRKDEITDDVKNSCRDAYAKNLTVYLNAIQG